jgi:hypothetical protein
VEGEDEAANEAPAPAADGEEEPLDFSKKKKKVRPSSLPARPRARTAICLPSDACATRRDPAEEAQG